jgi:DNA recombination protein RmuC
MGISSEYVLTALLIVLLGIVIWMMVTGRRRTRADLQVHLERLFLDQWAKSTEVIQKQGADLAERLARATGELRQSISDRFSSEFKSLHETLDAKLSHHRLELQEGLQRTTQALESRFAGLQEATHKALEEIRGKVDERLLAIGRDVQAKLDQNIREGFQHFERVQEHLKAAEAQLQNVGQVGASISELNALLKLPHLRGGFGEAALERLLADFLPSHLYELQAAIPGAGRVDALIRFPRATLPIDSKFPREQVLPLFEDSSPERLAEARKALSQVLRAEAARISRYIRPEEGTMDMALMFLPSETLYFETIRDAELWAELSRRKVFPVSPNTLAVTLRGISVAHDYYEMARNVKRTIEEIQKAQRHFSLFQQRFQEIGQSIERAQEAYRKASTHLGRYSGSVARLTADSQESDLRPEDEPP